jgi:Protein of unknown function (DUF3048) N-terminal domain/Protein of unknown function (DUF3048) C-terminal domain
MHAVRVLLRGRAIARVPPYAPGVLQNTQRRTVRRLGAALVLALAASACSGDKGVPISLPSRTPTPTPTPTPTQKPKPPPKPKPKPVNPLTGIGAPPKGPVIAVKIDNVADARPQVGLNAADVIYVEQAEGGLTRLLAVYASYKPRTVAPVRSVRNADPELLAQYGKIVLAFSGGAGGPLATFRRSGLVDGSSNARGGLYRRLSNKPAPHNLAVDLYLLGKALPAAAGARNVGFGWALRDPRLLKARHIRWFTLRMGSTTLSYSYDAAHQRFVATGPGGALVRDAAGQPLAKPNVLIQFCPTTVDRGDVDVAGNPASYTHTIGHGRALLFRDGRVIDGTWQRGSAIAPTQFLDKSGKPMLLRPGGTWVLLAPTNSPLQLSTT